MLKKMFEYIRLSVQSENNIFYFGRTITRFLTTEGI